MDPFSPTLIVLILGTLAQRSREALTHLLTCTCALTSLRICSWLHSVYQTKVTWVSGLYADPPTAGG